MESIKKTVGDNLKAVSKVKGIRNRQIAEYMNVSESCVSHWFRGDNSLDIDNLYKLCQFLGVSLDQIFGVDPIVFGVLNSDENDVLVAYRTADAGTKRSVRKLLDLDDASIGSPRTNAESGQTA